MHVTYSSNIIRGKKRVPDNSNSLRNVWTSQVMDLALRGSGGLKSVLARKEKPLVSIFNPQQILVE